jgi:hypothetical protein
MALFRFILHLSSFFLSFFPIFPPQNVKEQAPACPAMAFERRRRWPGTTIALFDDNTSQFIYPI